ncbi:MAG: hypothetical protein WEB85_08580 [Dongiaceae bacterium]
MNWVLGASSNGKGAGISPQEEQAWRRTQPAVVQTSPEVAAFERRLCEILRDNPAAAAGQISVVGFEELRDRLGERWLEMQDRIHTAAPAILKSHLGPADVFCRYGDDGYLISFARLSSNAAKVKCMAIAEEFSKFFLGQPDMATVSLKYAVGEIDDRLLFENFSIADLPPPVSGKTEQRVPAPPPKTLSSEAVAGSSDGARSGSDARRLEPLASHASSEEGESLEWRRLMDELPPLVGYGSTPEVKFAYQPIWDARNKILSTYLCIGSWDLSSSSRSGGVAAAPDADDGAATARLDLETLKNTVCMLDELVRNKFQLFIIVPLHFETLASAKFRDIYFEIARPVPRALRTFLVFEMVGLPDGVPQSRLVYFANSLKPFCGMLLIRTGLDRRDLERFVGIGAHAVGIDMGSVARPESEVFVELNRFVAEAEKCRLWTYVHGISTSSLAVGAIAAGVRYVDGRQVRSSTEVPAHIRRFGWEDYYSVTRAGSAARPR